MRRLLYAVIMLLIVTLPSGVFGQSGSTKITEGSSIRGNLSVTGAFNKSVFTFVLDHPLDPKNKLLFHSVVESPDVKNIYDGIATLDARGEAVIELPSYFFALNKDFRYLATPLGSPAPELHLAHEVHKKWFIAGTPVLAISGGTPGHRISWQVTGIRHDPYILMNPMTPEVDKGVGQPVEKGTYLNPEAYP